MSAVRKYAIPREVASLAILLCTVSAARSSLADHYMVPTGSMIPTVEPEDHVVVDKRAYGLRVPFMGTYALRGDGPARGDVVVLRSPEDGEVLLKRVVAIPGDHVSVEDGALVLGGAAMPIVPGAEGPVEVLAGVRHAVNLENGGGPDFGPIDVPRDRYLVLGDNRGNSRDGRWFGLVARDAILGRVRGVVLRHGSPTWVSLEGRR